MPPKTESRSGTRFLVAHRAGNHLDCLRRAEELGVALVEADIRLFRGRAEVRHLKSIGPVPVFWDRWKVANPFSRRLVLEELLEAVGPSTELMLDLKGWSRHLSQLVLDALARAPTVARLTVCARSWSLLEPFDGKPDIRTVYSIGSKRQLRAFRSRFEGKDKLAAISIHERFVDRQTMQHLRASADLVMTWPVRTAEHARRLIDHGVNGLITDTPEDLVGILSAEGVA